MPQEQDSSRQPEPEAVVSHMESKSSEEGNRTEEKGDGEVLRKSTTSQHASEKVTESVSGQEDQKVSQVESERTEAVESSVKETSNVEKVKEEKEEEKHASEKRTDEQVSTQVAATGVEKKEDEQKQEAKAGGGGGGWGWGGWSSIWSSMSTVTESTAQALGEKVRWLGCEG